MITDTILQGSLYSRGKKICNNIQSIFENSSDESINIIQVGSSFKETTGHIYDSCPNGPHDVSKTKLSFMKNSHTESPYNYVYDYCYTDKNGKYTVYLEPGEYKVRVETANRHFFYNQSITEGLNEYYSYVTDGVIKSKIEDTIQFYGTEQSQVVGRLFSEYNLPIAGQIVISQNNKLVVFVNSIDGNYNFLIDYGIYDVRLRASNRSVIIFHNFEYIKGKGFFTELLQHKIRGVSADYIENMMQNEQISHNVLDYDWTHHTR